MQKPKPLLEIESKDEGRGLPPLIDEQGSGRRGVEIPWGWVEHKGKAVPSFEKAREASIVDVFDWLGLRDTIHPATGANGAELKGWCPWGTDGHGNKGSFSVNVETTRGMCHACKRKCSHVVQFMTLYIETHPGDSRFTHIQLKGDQAAAQWLIEMLQSETDDWEAVDEQAQETVEIEQAIEVEPYTPSTGIIVHDTDALVYVLRGLGEALLDEGKLAEFVEIIARP